PALEAALASSPVTVIADPSECSFQLKLTGTESFTTSCDIAKSALVARSVNYDNETAPKGTVARVKIGEQLIAANVPSFATVLGQAITAHGYPAAADTSKINYPMTVILLTVLVIFVTLVYAPIAAWLVELFPTRIRYSGMSLPYHIGNGWFGGFLPATVFAIVAATGNIYSGLWYPIIVACLSLGIGFLFLPETNDPDISAHRPRSNAKPRRRRGFFLVQRGCEPAFCQRRRLCLRPSETSVAASLIGAPIPSTTGTPSSLLSQSGFICTGHWVMPCGMMTSARSSSISARAAIRNDSIILSRL